MIRYSLSILASLALWAAMPAAHAAIVQTWGLNTAQFNPQPNNTAPLTLPGMEVDSVAAGGFHVLVLKNGALTAWGSNGYGTLGNGIVNGSVSPQPVPGFSSNVTSVAGGSVNSYAIQNGALFAWGDNSRGQIGDGTTTARLSPVAVPALASDVTSVTVGWEQVLAIRNGGLLSWGRNLHGQLGVGDTTNRNTPTAIASLATGVTAAAGGETFSLAIQNGAALAWGRNLNGQLGDGTTTGQKSIPQAVLGLSSGVTAVSAGKAHSMAIKDGNVYAWGANAQGQVGNGGAGNVGTPTMVLDLPQDVVAISAHSDYSSYALSAAGSLWVWGGNAQGQLGLGDLVNRSTPTQLLAPAGFRYDSISAGQGFAVATLVAVPEPGSCVMAAMGGVAALVARRRRG